MSLKLSEGGKKDFGRIEDGTYPARVVQIIDMGEQVATHWKTGEVETWDDGNTKVQRKCFIQFEFPTERIETSKGNQPRWQGKEFVISNHEKSALGNLLKAAGVSTITGLLGKAVLCTIASTSGGNAKIANISGVMKGMEVGELENDTVVFDLDNPDNEVFESLPQWVQAKINNRVKGKPPKAKPAPVAAPAGDDDFDDDIPF